MPEQTVLAVDLGAESGRVMAVRFDGQRLSLEEMHRFSNRPVMVRGTMHWDILRLWHEVQAGIDKARKAGPVASIGVDTWGVDFGLLDRNGNLLANPVHYRDRRTDGMVDWVFSRVPREEIFAQTGIQTMALNTLFQLASLVKNNDPVLDCAAEFLFLPDLFYFWLTGVRAHEFCIASTSHMFNSGKREWAWDVMERVGIPTRLFKKDVHMPGQSLGAFDGIPVVLAPHHDTASAVVGAPARNERFAYLSSGTWSLLGMELDTPINTEAAARANVTNEGGFGGTIRFLKNIVGLWLIQECRRNWADAGQEYGYDHLCDMASQSAPFVSLIDPDDPLFITPGDMVGRVRQRCAETGQPAPETVGAMARCIFESLALKYRYVVRLLMRLSGREVETLHIIGGGSQNRLLCQMAADATGIPVVGGPVEATALGNAISQLIALGSLKNIGEGRALLHQSFPLEHYTPQNTAAWDAQEARFNRLVEQSEA